MARFLFKSFSQSGFSRLTSVALLLAGLVFVPPALAHHALDGQTPINFGQGFLSGLAHPIIGLDHFAFIIAVGLLAARQATTWLLPGTFVGAALLGTALHLQQVNLPLVEVGIALSVVLFGGLLLLNRHLPSAFLLGLGAIAGLLHGYAYGESIVGAGMPPLMAYLLGFSLMQFGIAMAALWVGDRLLRGSEQQSINRSGVTQLRYAGLAIAALGFVFLSRTVIG